ncbi:hypothetical protein [Nocardia wallacei]|uniref:hypothetical protein n=1 Tax=Nocardia wallacei TaxID=480035 RepID=UPI002453EAD7|nr:hypothetical protein [Nocardia wallacei]
MSWPEHRLGLTDPQYYHDAADSTEQQLRADFAHHCYLLDLLPYAENDAQAGEFQQWADELATRWGRHDNPRWRHLWSEAHTAKTTWDADPATARTTYRAIERARATGETAVDDTTWRTLRQAREITGRDHTTPVAGSAQDAHHRPAPAPSATAATRDIVDRRTAVQKTLGAPPGTTPDRDWSVLDRVDAVLAATDETLADEETAALIEQRSHLLPREVLDAPIIWDYSTDALWDTRQALLLRQLQDLTAEHATVVDSFTDTGPAATLHTDLDADQARIDRLEQLQTALSAARVDALRAGVPHDEVDHAYLLGRDGIHWSVEPGSHRLGRIAQLTEQRDAARAEADTLQTRVTELQRRLDPTSTPRAEPEIPSAADPSPPDIATDGAGISTAIDTALPDRGRTDWHVPEPSREPLAADHSEAERGHHLPL